jgi:hypothetical protein
VPRTVAVAGVLGDACDADATLACLFDERARAGVA